MKGASTVSIILAVLVLAVIAISALYITSPSIRIAVHPILPFLPLQATDEEFQIIVRQPEVFVGEIVNLEFFCGDVNPVSCSIGDKVELIAVNRDTGISSTFNVGAVKDSSGGCGSGGTCAFTIFTPQTAGSYLTQFCIIRSDGFRSCESATNLLVKAKTVPAPQPQCQARWECRDISTSAYKNSDCSYTNLQNCPNGCQDGACRVAPPAPPAPTGGYGGTPTSVPSNQLREYVCPDGSLTNDLSTCEPITKTTKFLPKKQDNTMPIIIIAFAVILAILIIVLFYVAMKK